MQLSCKLAEIREVGGQSLRAVARLTGIDASSLGRIEHGRQLPLDEQVPVIEAAYGCAIEDVYDSRTLLAIQRDEPKRIIVTRESAA